MFIKIIRPDDSAGYVELVALSSVKKVRRVQITSNPVSYSVWLDDGHTHPISKETYDYLLSLNSLR